MSGSSMVLERYLLRLSTLAQQDALLLDRALAFLVSVSVYLLESDICPEGTH